jgi:Ca2+-binding RTX toxin-like protein
MATINVSSTAALNTALKAAQAGDTILLSSGTYTMSASGLHFATDVTVASASASNPAVITNLSITDSSGITVRDLDLNALASGGNNPFKIYRSQDIHLERLDVHGSLDGNPQNDVRGLLVRESQNVSVSDSEFRDLADGLSHIDSAGLTVARNEFHHITYDAVRGGGSSNVTISGNYFHDFFPKVGDHPDVIQFWTTNTTASAKNIVITDNAFVRGAGAAVQGIFMRDQVGTLPYDGVTITGNVVAGGMYHGLSITGARNVKIDDNIVQGFIDMKSWIRLEKVDGATVTNNSANEVILVTTKNVVLASNTILPAATDAGAWAFAQWDGPDTVGDTGPSGPGGDGATGATGLSLVGDTGSNTLTGAAGADTLDGRGGADLLTGGAGDDVFVAGSKAKVVEAASGGSDLVRSAESIILPANVEKLELIGVTSVTGHGNDLANTIVGNGGGNYLRGYAGADTLDGRAANDMLQGDGGDDRLIGGAGNDTFVFKLGGGRDTIADFSAGDVIDASALLQAGARVTLTVGTAGLNIGFGTGESIVLAGRTMDDIQGTATGWIFG